MVFQQIGGFSNQNFHNYNHVQDVSSKYKVLSNPKQFLNWPCFVWEV